MPKIGIFGQFGPGHAGLFSALLWVGWWCGARAVSRKTPIYFIKNITIIIILTNIIGACKIYLECNLGSHLRVKLGRNQRQDCINATLFVFHNHHHRQHHLLSSWRPPRSTLTLQLPCAHPISHDCPNFLSPGRRAGKIRG